MENNNTENKQRFEDMRKKMKNQLNFKKVDGHQTEEEQRIRKENEKFGVRYISGDFPNYFEEKEILGEGTMGIVKKVRRKSDNVLLAAKLVKTRDDEIITNIIIEFKNASVLDHPNIVKIYELYIDTALNRVYTIMELVDSRELFDVIHKFEHFSESLASKIFAQILHAVHYLHNMKCCHRDLKPNNILVSEDGQIVKITDFNISKFGDRKEKTSALTQKVKMLTYTGTIAFNAPEVLEMGEYDESVDMWSLGCVLYVMLSGKGPFEAEYVQEVVTKIKNVDYTFPEEYWNQIGDQAKDLIKQCLVLDSKVRLTADQALMHPWVQNKCCDQNIQAAKVLGTTRSRFLTKFAAKVSLGLARHNQKRHNSISFQPELLAELHLNNPCDMDEIYEVISPQKKRTDSSNRDSQGETKDKDSPKKGRSQFKPQTNVLDDRYHLTESQEILAKIDSQMQQKDSTFKLQQNTDSPQHKHHEHRDQHEDNKQ